MPMLKLVRSKMDRCPANFTEMRSLCRILRGGHMQIQSVQWTVSRLNWAIITVASANGLALDYRILVK